MLLKKKLFLLVMVLNAHKDGGAFAEEYQQKGVPRLNTIMFLQRTFVTQHIVDHIILKDKR